MNLPYIITVALILAACLSFYKILLRHETFYRVNRYMLIVCLGVSFLLPLVSVPEQFSLRKTGAVEQKTEIRQPEINTQQSTSGQPTQKKETGIQEALSPAASPNDLTSSRFSFDQFMTWLFWIYWFGVMVFAASFLFQVVLLFWRSRRNPAIIDGPYRIVEVSGDKAPCSFGNTIFINPEKYDWETYSQIILHEKIHIREKHTLDILVAELLLIFQWFNPFAWIYRREIESNLEYLTDDQLMQKEKVDKKSYQLSLMKVSAPHFPLSLTTNYNQSILKKRIAMMNRKRSNLHTAWKYFFLVPVFAFLACLLNEPVVFGQKENNTTAANNKNERNGNIDTEGYWFAIIKDDKVNIRFSDKQMDEDTDFKSGHSFNGNTFKLSDLGNIPRGTSGTFLITREAGKMELTGKFEGNTGMGTYQFIADKGYVDFMSKELNEKLDEDEQLAFFFIDIRRDYLAMLKKEGFTRIGKDDLIPMAALKIDAAYIKSIKDAGFKDVTMENLVPLKALHVDARYIKEIRDAGYKDVTTEQLVTFKSQGIDKEYITSVRKLKGKDEKDDPEDIVTFKAMNIDEAFINSFKAVGLANIPHEQLVAFKALGITPEYIKSWQDAGFRDIELDEYPGLKSQNVTPEYLKSFTDMGFKNVKPEELVAFKALHITPEYVKSFETAGYKIEDLDNLPGLKSQNITPEFIKSFEALGFKNIDLGEMVAVKAVGVTPDYIKEMRAKGFNYNSLHKYVTLKSID